MTESPLNASAIVEALNRYGVDYVVIGAFAALAHRAPIPATNDIDLTPLRTTGNLDRLSAALRELDARVRVDGAPEGLRFDHDAVSLGSSDTWNLICPFGEFDICFAPSAFPGGYLDLIDASDRVEVDGVVVSIAGLTDIIASKEAAGRPKDLRVLPLLVKHLHALRASDEGRQL